MAFYMKNGHCTYAIAPPPGKEFEEYTIEIIFKSTDTTGSNVNLSAPPIFCCQSGNNYSHNPSVMININRGQLTYWYYNNWDFAGYVTDGNWHKVVCIRKNALTYIYLDDELKVCRSFLPKMPNSNVVLTYNWYNNLSAFRNEVIYIKYFKLYDKALEENEFFKNISYSPLYSIPGIFKYIKKDSDLYLKDWSGNNNDFNCVEPTNLKSDVIISNLSLKE